MDKNKSIDGLTVHRPKKAPTRATTKKTTARTSSKSPKSTPKPSKSPKPVVKSQPINKTPVEPHKSHPISITTPTEQSVPQDSEVPTANSTEDHTPLASAEDFLKPVQAFDFDEQSGELKASTTPTDNTPKKPKKEKKKMSKKRKIILSIILTIVFILIAGVIWFIIWGNDIIAKITGGQGNVLDLLTFMEEKYEPLKTDENGRTNILAFGTSGYNMEGDEGNGTHDGAQLTDSIMVISLNQETGDVAMLSLPRDLKASPTCTATGKINEVYWCNNINGDDEQAGAQALMAEVGNILGIDFQYYSHLNWGSLVQIVDTLGGINITLDEDISDYYWTGAVFEAGTEYTINGEQALGLARARHGTSGGDFSRGASQQKILIGIKNKVFEKNLSITDILSLASTLGDNLRTNFSIEEMKTLAHLTSTFDFDNMRQISLIEPERLMTTGTINGISYVLPSGGAGYYTRIQDYVAKMLSNDPRIYEDSSILVLNGTETPGLASTEQAALESDKYQNIYIDDAPEGEYTDQYTLYALTDTAPNTRKLLEEKYNTQAKTPEELPEGIITECDFVLIIGNTASDSTND
ncbi:LCP family protein [Candidatus Saccharibacteria bacterium]|nr:LCP family protein [Candidatus Saccharibacteria bacterium]